MIHKSIKIFFILLMLFLIASVAYAEEGYTDPSKLNITVDPKAQPLSLYDWAYDYNYETSVILVDGQPYNVWKKEHPGITLSFKEQVKGPGMGTILVNVYYYDSVEHDSYDGAGKNSSAFHFQVETEGVLGVDS
jgi:hypothetical protein